MFFRVAVEKLFKLRLRITLDNLLGSVSWHKKQVGVLRWLHEGGYLDPYHMFDAKPLYQRRGRWRKPLTDVWRPLEDVQCLILGHSTRRSSILFNRQWQTPNYSGEIRSSSCSSHSRPSEIDPFRTASAPRASQRPWNPMLPMSKAPERQRTGSSEETIITQGR